MKERAVMTTRRARIAELLKEEISEILRREMKDPRLGFVTITDAEVSADLRHAKVFVSIMGSEQERKSNMDLLKKAERFVRQAVGKRLSMKVLPDIHFFLDTSVDQGIRMFELLDQIKRNDENESS